MENVELRFRKAVNKEQNENLRRNVELCSQPYREDKRSIEQKWEKNDFQRSLKWNLIKCMRNMFGADGSTWPPTYYYNSLRP